MDTLSEGLTYNNDLLVKIDDRTLSEGKDYTLVVDKQKITVDFVVDGKLVKPKEEKVENKNEALNDIYKVLRPGEAPSIEIAEEIFNNLYFKKERYDLSEVGRVKLNSKLNLSLIISK